MIGLFAKKLQVQEGDFGKDKVAVFTVANVIAHVVGWVVVAPVLDIVIYAEPANKVFAQGAFAAVSNTITGVVVGGLLILAYQKQLQRKAPWIRNKLKGKFVKDLAMGKLVAGSFLMHNFIGSKK